MTTFEIIISIVSVCLGFTYVFSTERRIRKLQEHVLNLTEILDAQHTFNTKVNKQLKSFFKQEG